MSRKPKQLPSYRLHLEKLKQKTLFLWIVVRLLYLLVWLLNHYG